MNDVKEWLKIAKSNFIVGKSFYILSEEDVRFEEFCFELQQSVEKSLKALLVHHNIKFPKTHSISALLTLLQENSVNLPEKILDAAELTKYAIETRYPDNYIEITEKDYEEAVQMAEYVYEWVKIQIQS